MEIERREVRSAARRVAARRVAARRVARRESKSEICGGKCKSESCGGLVGERARELEEERASGE